MRNPVPGVQESAKENVSTQETSCATGARLSRSHADEGWPQGDQGASWQGAPAYFTLIVAVKGLQRLRATTDLTQVRKAGRSWAHPLLALSAKENGLAYSRFAFVASKHVGSAVARNRAKRRMREVVRLRQADIAPGWDLLLIARKPIAAASYQEIEHAIVQLLRQAKLESAE